MAMAMATARRRPFLILLHNLGEDYSGGVGESGGWAAVECATKASYGCGPLGHHVVQGVSLLARLAGDDDDDKQHLRVHATDDLLRRVGSETDMAAAAGIRFVARVEAVEATGGVIVVVMSVWFSASNNGKDRGSYYLVYDSGAGGSLSLLPRSLLPHGHDCSRGPPLPVRRHGHGDHYSLVLMSSLRNSDPDDDGQPVFCLWSPTTDLAGPWRMLPWGRRVEATPPGARFTGGEVQAFSCGGKAVWADPAQGVLCCDMDALQLAADSADSTTKPVEFSLVALPEQYRIPQLQTKHRAIGPSAAASGTIWFVSVDSHRHPGDTTVAVWSLDLSGPRRWDKHRELSLLSIWAAEGFVRAGLPRRVPWSPFFWTDQRDSGGGGVIYFLLPPADDKDPGAHVIGIDMRNSCGEEVRVLPLGRLARLFRQRPMLLPRDFLCRQRHRKEEEEASIKHIYS